MILVQMVANLEKDTKYYTTKKGPNNEIPQIIGATMNQQQQNPHPRTDGSLSDWGRVLNVVNWGRKAPNVFSSHGGFNGQSQKTAT